MKKGWIQKSIKENAWGLKFTRWYVVAPSGNCYFFYKSCDGKDIYLHMKIKADNDESKPSKDDRQEIASSYNDAIKYIYSLEEKGGMGKKYNEDVKNLKEFKFLYSSKYDKNSYSYCW